MPQKKVDAIWIVFGGRRIKPLGGKIIYIDEAALDKLSRHEMDNAHGRAR